MRTGVATQTNKGCSGHQAPEIDDMIWNLAVRIGRSPFRIRASDNQRTRVLSPSIARGMGTSYYICFRRSLCIRRRFVRPPVTSRQCMSSRFTRRSAAAAAAASWTSRPAQQRQPRRRRRIRSGARLLGPLLSSKLLEMSPGVRCPQTELLLRTPQDLLSSVKYICLSSPRSCCPGPSD